MSAQVSVSSTAAAPGGRQLFPGYLLTPLGWAAQPLAQIVAAEPSLLSNVFELNRPRMHLFALAVAHLDADAVPKIGSVLLHGSARHVLDSVLGGSPVGIKRVLRRLPPGVLRCENYRRLVELLQDPKAGKLLLQHTDDLDDFDIEAVYDLPAVLRPIVLTVLRDLEEFSGLGEGLRLLVARGAAPSFEALIADLTQHVQPGQFVARLRQLIEELPLPEAMPPAQIGKARRLDSSKEIQALARNWHNCLARYVREVEHGQCAIYLWDDPASPAACQVSREGRLGWALHVPLGPKNASIEAGQVETICNAFAAAGVPQVAGAYGLQAILRQHQQPYW